jgi:hypothetical protein
VSDPVCRIDFTKSGELDDVAISDVEMFRLEYMDTGSVWIRLYMRDGKDHVFWLNSSRAIKGDYHLDERS